MVINIKNGKIKIGIAIYHNFSDKLNFDEQIKHIMNVI